MPYGLANHSKNLDMNGLAGLTVCLMPLLQVAEMTGRQKRMERAPGGGYKYVSRTEFYDNCCLDDVSVGMLMAVGSIFNTCIALRVPNFPHMSGYRPGLCVCVHSHSLGAVFRHAAPLHCTVCKEVD